MAFSVDTLRNDNIDEYERFALSDKKHLFYISSNYKEFLEKVIGCKSKYLIVYNKNKTIEAALPLMIYENDTFGPIINSLPYFGSNGGIIANPNLSKIQKDKYRIVLLKELSNIAIKIQAAACTIITSPFESDINWYENHMDYDLTDKRIGQITKLPKNDSNDVESALFGLFQNPRPRNIRKAIKNDIQVRFDCSKEAFRFLYETHHQNITGIGGKPKDWRFFDEIESCFSPKDYGLFVASKNDSPIAALLLFYYNRTVEYFTPAIKSEFRTYQPLSLLIFEAMKHAIEAGFQYWNWGGTWLTQDGVYQFKSKWGSKDYPYFYFTKIFNDQIRGLSIEVIMEEFPNFYVIPFKELK